MPRTARIVMAALLATWTAACGDGDGDEGDATTDTSQDSTDADADGTEDSAETTDGADAEAGDPDVEADVDDDGDAIDVLDEDAPVPDPALAFVYTVATDWSGGSYSVIDLDDLTVHPDLGSMHTDGKALCLDGQVFLHELFGSDTVDPVGTDDPWDITDRWSTGAMTNPVDGVLSDAAHMLVVLAAGTGLAELDLTDGTIGASVDLSSFDAFDGLPDAHAVAHVGNRYYVSMQLLQSWAAVEPGVVAVVDDTTLEPVDADTSTAGIVDGIVLPGTNPVGRFRVIGDDLYVALAGVWGSVDGGVAVVHTATLAAEWVVEGSDFGGDPTFGDCLEIADATTAYLCFGTSDGTLDAIRRFDPATGVVDGSNVLETTNGSLSGSALTGDGRMMVGDRSTAGPGIRIIDTSTGVELTSTPLQVGDFAPYAMCVNPG